MHHPRYTASFCFDNHFTLQQTGDDYQSLLVHLMTSLDNVLGEGFGEIRDNVSGEILHQCKKSKTMTELC